MRQTEVDMKQTDTAGRHETDRSRHETDRDTAGRHETDRSRHETDRDTQTAGRLEFLGSYPNMNSTTSNYGKYTKNQFLMMLTSS